MPAVGAFISGFSSFLATGAVAGAGIGGAWAAGAAAASWITTGAVGRLLSSVALSALSQALAPKPKQPGIRTTATQSGGVNSEGFILGWYATEGQLVAPPMSHGKSGKTPNAYLNYVIEVGGIPGQTLDGVILDGEPVDIGTEPDADYGLPLLGRFEGKAWIRYHDGRQTAADAMLVAKYPAPYVRPWGAERIGAGICYAVMTFRYDREVYSGFPKVRFVLGGIPLYDPRKDGTAGGSGSHRFGQPATYEPSVNPVVQVYNILRGIALPGGDVWGGECAAEDLPLATWASAMTVADVSVGGNPRYRAGLEVLVEDEPFSVIEELLKGCSGQLSEMGGVWSIRVGAPGLPVYFVTDDDIIVTSPEDFDPFPAPEATYNGVAANYPDPRSGWEGKDATPRYDAAWEAEDGGRRLVADLTLPAAPYPAQVRRLMAAYAKDARRWRRHTLTLPPDAAALMPLDLISWTSARNYYSAKLFEVVEVVRDPVGGLVQVLLRERDPSDYDPPSVTLPDPPTLTPQLPTVQAVPGWSVSGVSILDGAGTARRPALLVGWTADAMEDAEGLRWQVRVAGQAVSLRGSTQDIEAGQRHIHEVLPATVYEARARIIAPRPTEWSNWISATTPGVKLGPADLDWSELEAEILDQLSTLEDWINSELDLAADAIAEAEAEIAALTAEQAQQAADLAQQASQLATEAAARGDLAITTAQHYRDLARSVQAIRDYVADLDYQSYTAREELRRQISVVVEGYAASFDERITVAASATGAIAERVIVLEAESDDLGARIIAVDTARVDGENALAQQIAAVSVGTNTQFDQSDIWYFDAAIEGWAGSPSNPTATGGYLRPPTGSGAWVASPVGLAVDTQVYSQVRARLRRVGSPSWAGALWWQAAGQGWAAGRSIAITAPVWVDGIADVTVTPEWSGTLDQIRLDLAAVSDASNYIEIDWVAIGRPSPGASRAELVAERTARISADEAQATAITELEASLTDIQGDTTATANAVQALDGRVITAEGLLTAQATAITGLQSDLGDKASAAAVSELTTEVSELSGGLTSQSAAVVALRNSIDPLAAEGIDAQFAAFLADGAVREALATADEVLRTDVGVQADAVVVLSEKVTALESAVPGLATSSALNALTTRVTVAEASITSQASAITALQSDVAGKASASALSSLTTRVTSAENAIASQSTAITSLQSDVAGKASASAVSSLTTRVTDAETAISSQSIAITNLENDVAGKASSSAVGVLTSRVTTVETVAGSKNRVFRQATAPSGLVAGDAGDLWFDTDDNDKCWRWSGSGWVSVQDKAIPALQETVTSHASAITSLQSDVAGKASASALSTLDTKVTNVETTANGKNKVFRASTAPTATGVGDIWFDTSQGSKCYRWGGSTWVSVQDRNIPSLIAITTAQSTAITDLQSDLSGKASASALNALTTRVSTAEGEISGQADALTALNTTVGKFSAGGRFRISVEATPAGATSRIGLSATASDGADTQTAALFLEATSSGDSRVLVRADRFAIINGSARDVPFIVDGGSTYIKKALIKEADIDTLKIAGNAVTTVEYEYLPNGEWLIDSKTTETTIVSLIVPRTAGFRTRIGFACTLENPRSSGSTTYTEIRLYRGSTLVNTWSHLAVAAPDGIQDAKSFSMVDFNTGGGETTYSIRAIEAPNNAGGGRSGIIRRPFLEAQQFKR